MLNEKGFTLVEILTSLFILGLLVFFTIPLLKELRGFDQHQVLRLEASSLVQEKMEKLTSMLAFPDKGKESKVSRVIQKVRYDMTWDCQLKQRNVYKIVVEIQWSKGEKNKNLKLCTYRYIPTLEMKKDIRILS